MLTLTLRGLQRDGLVERRTFATIPPKVEYELTQSVVRSSRRSGR
ncbi:winged helix-turn-helix transcriptional regulator [Methylosinus sp. R-45379]